MGVADSERAHMLKLTTAAFGAGTPRERSVAHQEILLYFAGLISERRRSPTDDLVSLLVQAEIDGAKLTDEEILLNCDNLIVGGIENVRHAAAGGLLALIEKPDQWRRLQAAPTVIDTAVEEILRWTSPALHIMRTAASDVAVGGQIVRAGEAVVIWNPSANRDEDAFPLPEEFDVTRTPNRHLSLGAGEHFCIGAGLARRELHALFEQLARSVSSVDLAGPVQRLRSFTILGIERLPITVMPLS
jgi:cytochrome P450